MASLFALFTHVSLWLFCSRSESDKGHWNKYYSPLVQLGLPKFDDDSNYLKIVVKLRKIPVRVLLPDLGLRTPSGVVL